MKPSSMEGFILFVSWLSSWSRSMTPKPACAPALILLACSALAACSEATKKAEDPGGNRGSAQSTQATQIPPPPTPSPTPGVAPLRTPERVASGEVTESGGTWNSAVQRITYVSSADNTSQPITVFDGAHDNRSLRHSTFHRQVPTAFELT